MVAITSGTKGQLMNTFDPCGIDIKVGKTSEKRNPIPGKGDYQPPIEDKVEQKTRKPQRTFLDDLDAIAYGVEAWFEENTDSFRNMSETTVGIARKLGVPEDEIRRWAARRSTFDAEKVKLIKSLLQRLRASSPADGLKTRNIKRSNPG